MRTLHRLDEHHVIGTRTDNVLERRPQFRAADDGNGLTRFGIQRVFAIGRPKRPAAESWKRESRKLHRGETGARTGPRPLASTARILAANASSSAFTRMPGVFARPFVDQLGEKCLELTRVRSWR